MKKCYKCGEDKELTEFNKNKAKKDGLQTKCRECDKATAISYFRKNRSSLMPKIAERKKGRIIRNRLYVESYLRKHPCIDCNNSDIRVLEFDHQRDKIQTVGYLVRSGCSLKKVSEEMDKCEVRCANCHRIKTGIDFNYYGYLAEMD